MKDHAPGQIRNHQQHLTPVKEMWESQWNIHLLNYRQLDIIKPLHIPEITSILSTGGRTKTVMAYHKIQEDEQTHYIDYMSLYTLIHKNREYPVGYPEYIDHPGQSDVS